jgi:hypothetical protein
VDDVVIVHHIADGNIGAEFSEFGMESGEVFDD